MFQRYFRSGLIPAGLVVDQVRDENGKTIVATHASSEASQCPACGSLSRRIHSRYCRTISDLPAHGHAVVIEVTVRRFRCVAIACQRRIFAERLAGETARPFARRTVRLDKIVHCCGIALGGRPAARLARRLMLPVSRDTLLRTVRRRARRYDAPLHVVGIDDWAWKRGQRYGTLICDLERRRIVDLLPDRDAGTVAAWLAAHPDITNISRDRGGGYGQAAKEGAPQAIQVADRWHLMENASEAFLRAVRQSMRLIRQALGSTIIDPTLLTSAERLQYEGYRRREETGEIIRALAAEGMPVKEIVRRVGLSRNHVRDIIKNGCGDVFRSRTTSLAPYLESLDAEWNSGCRRGAELWRRLRRIGFAGSLRVVSEWATRRRRSEKAGLMGLGRVPSARMVARLLTIMRDGLSKGDATMVSAIEASVPTLVAARDLLLRFQTMVRSRTAKDLKSWIEEALDSLMASFAVGLAADYQAVSAAFVEPWSNGQTEGQITKLKLVKRQMYGRAKLDLLRARLMEDLHRDYA
jgi:transposase